MSKTFIFFTLFAVFVTCREIPESSIDVDEFSQENDADAVHSFEEAATDHADDTSLTASEFPAKPEFNKLCPDKACLFHGSLKTTSDAEPNHFSFQVKGRKIDAKKGINLYALEFFAPGGEPIENVFPVEPAQTGSLQDIFQQKILFSMNTKGVVIRACATTDSTAVCKKKTAVVKACLASVHKVHAEKILLDLPNSWNVVGNTKAEEEAYRQSQAGNAKTHSLVATGGRDNKKRKQKNNKKRKPKKKMLDLPPRQQWNTKHKYWSKQWTSVYRFYTHKMIEQQYCACLALQTAAMYYGTWVSQRTPHMMMAAKALKKAHTKTTGLAGTMHVIREYTRGMDKSPSAYPYFGSLVIPPLKLRFQQWIPAKSDRKLYKKFMVWMKGHLVLGHPTLFTTYVRDEHDSDYDHILQAVGVRSRSLSSDEFDSRDVLFYNDGFDLDHRHNRTFGNFHDSRAMKTNCLHRDSRQPNGWSNGDFWRKGKYAWHYECISNDRPFGTAMIGIVDENKETVPVRITVSSGASEPNPAKRIHATVSITDLKHGRKYVLLRYGSFEKVPSKNFLRNRGFDYAHKFTADGKTKKYRDPHSFMSDTIQIYRCVGPLH